MSKLAIVLMLILAGCSSAPQPAPQPKKAAAPEPVKILQFYASPAEVAKGEPVNVCYGVENATGVRIEPEIEPIRPAFNHCLQFTPKRSQTYTLIATGATGKVTESFSLKVGGKAVADASRGNRMIQVFAASGSGQLTPGQSITLCYSIQDAVSAKFEPNIHPVRLNDRECFTVTPPKTTTYKLRVTGANGEKETATTIVHVN
jgi:hypothetical protein